MLRRSLLVLIPVLALIGWLAARGSTPPEVPYTEPKRESIVSTLTTNGKVEPVQWAAVHAESSGPVLRVHVERGQAVSKGQILATIGSAEAAAELSTAQSRVRAAQAEIETLDNGGRAAERAEIESGVARARADLQTAEKDAAVLERLVARKAATAAELTAAKDGIRRLQQQIESYELRRKALVTQPDRQAAEARLSEAQGGVVAASRRISESQVRSPMDGTLYDLEIRPGVFVQPGTPIARIGRLEQLRVTVFVDEPELGRIARNMPVSISWPALPGRTWKGQVESLPLQIVPVGTRQVGEVICLIDNPDHSLIPGTNVDAEIRSKAVENALTLPREVLRREGNDTGVLKVVGDRLLWQKVKVGVASVTRVQITEGIGEGDRVALPIDAPVKSGDRIRPVSRG